jgi:hypothetical protein
MPITLVLFMGALSLALVEVKSGVFLGDESKGFPVLLIAAQIMVVLGNLVCALTCRRPCSMLSYHLCLLIRLQLSRFRASLA